MSLLKTDKELVTKLGLTDVHETSVEEKKDYLDAQIDSIKSIIWRNRVDVVLNKHIKTEGKEQAKQVADKIDQFETDIERYAEAVTLMEQLKSEL